MGWYGFSYGFLVVLNLIHKKLTKKRATSKIWTTKKKVNKHLPPPPPKEIHRLGPVDSKIYILERNPRL
jgi:hypothetical protein